MPALLNALVPLRIKKAVWNLMPHSFNREGIAAQYLRGVGIEIGALHRPMPVPKNLATVRYVDRLSGAELRRLYPELQNEQIVEPDIIDDGEVLGTLADESQDFIISSHMLEHCEDPLTAARNMFRVLKPGGILYLVLPDKRYTFDVLRAPTPIAHIVRDFREGPAWSRSEHYADYVRHVEDRDEIRAAQMEREQENIHFHVFTQAEMLDLLGAMRHEAGLRFDVEVSLKLGIESIFVLRKLPAGEPAMHPLARQQLDVMRRSQRIIG